MIIDKPRRVLATGLAALALSLAGTAHATLINDEVTFEYIDFDNGTTETRTSTVADEFDLGPFEIDFEIEGGNGVIEIAGDFRIFGNEALRVLDLDWTDEASRLVGIEGRGRRRLRRRRPDERDHHPG